MKFQIHDKVKIDWKKYEDYPEYWQLISLLDSRGINTNSDCVIMFIFHIHKQYNICIGNGIKSLHWNLGEKYLVPAISAISRGYQHPLTKQFK